MKKIYSLFLALFFSASVFAAGHTVGITYIMPTCNGLCNGSATASVGGGVGPFTYSWSPSGGTSATASSLCAGSYTVIVTDNSDLSTATATVVISQPPLLTIGAGGATICSGSCTTLSPLASGGTPPYTFSWSGGLFGPTPSACPASTTTYTVTVTDANACVATGTRTVTVNPLPVVTANSPTICSGSTATLTGGGASTYVWNPGGATGVSMSVSPATTASYTVTGAGSGGCTASAVSTVTVNPLPTVTVTSPTICAGDTATMVQGGATTYVWSAGATPTGASSATASPMTTTTYTVTGSLGGCTNSAISTVYVTPTPTATVPVSATYCPGATVPIGTFSCPTCSPGPGNFTWTNSNTAIGLAASGISSVPSFTAMNTGSTPITSTITVTPTYAGCPGTPNTYTITVNPVPTITTSPSTTVCAGACISITATVSGGTPPYNYTWSPAGTSPIASPTVCPTGTTIYTATVADMNGCVAASVTTTVTVNPPMISGITSANASGCVSCDGTASVAPVFGVGPYVYLWSDPLAQTTATATALCAGTYVAIITDASGCTVTDSTTVFANNDVAVNFTMVPDSANPYNFFAFNSSTGTGNAYDWSWGDGSPNSTTANPSHTWGATGVMTVCLTASNFLCGADTLCQTVNVTGVSSPCNALFNIADDTINPDPNAHYVYNLSYGATLTYLWDFGDGTTSTSATPSHVYSGTGPYLLCLSIDNGAGCTDMFCDSLISADSINRSSGIMQLVVYDVPTFYSVATDIDNAIATNNVTIAPNPFNETTIFTVNSNEVYSFELTDVLGKKVKFKNGISEKQFEISRDALENGIYFYKIYTPESVIGIGKVVIK